MKATVGRNKPGVNKKHKDKCPALPLALAYRINSDKSIEIRSQYVENFTGYRRSEFDQGLSWKDVVHPDDIRVVRRAWETPGEIRTRYRIIKKNGDAIWVEDISRPCSADDWPSLKEGFVLPVTTGDEKVKNVGEKYKRIMDNLPDAVMMADLGTMKLIYANPSLVELLGYAREELLDKSIPEIIDPLQRAEQKKTFLQFLREGRYRIPDRILIKRNGVKVHTDLYLFIAEYEGKMVVVGIFRDMTDYWKAMDELNSYNKLYRAITFALPSTIILLDLEFRVVFVNDKFIQLAEVIGDEVIGRRLMDILPGGMLKDFGFIEKLRHVRDSSRIFGPREVPFRSRSGKPFVFKQTIYPISYGGKASGILILMDDITEQRNAEESLLKKKLELDLMNDELKSLTIEMSRLEEKERKRFSGMIHDGIGQNLIAIKMTCLNLINMCAAKGREAEGMKSEIRSLLDKTIALARSMSSELYPVSPNDAGLINAVKWYIKNIMEPGKIKVMIDMDERAEELPEEIKQGIYRVVQECLQNIFKHSSATEAGIICRTDISSVRLSIKDNGMGFPKGTAGIKPGPGVGLMLMRERVRSMGGNIILTSRPNEGTTVLVELPSARRINGAMANEEDEDIHRR